MRRYGLALLGSLIVASYVLAGFYFAGRALVDHLAQETGPVRDFVQWQQINAAVHAANPDAPPATQLAPKDTL